jgi:AAA domain
MIDLRSLQRALGGEISDGQLRCPGPGHSAIDRSLSVKIDSNAPDGFLVHTFSPADDPIACKDYVREKLGLPAFKPNGGNGRGRASDDAIERALMAAVQGQRAERPKGRLVATFDYTDENAQLLYQVLKYDPKDFRQRRPNGNGGFIWSLDDARRVLYRWPELLKFPDATVFICEGEKDADRVASLGHCATTVAHGKWTDDCVQALVGRDVIILQDNDKGGRTKALEAAQALHGTATSIRIVPLPDLPNKGDVSDWLDADPRRAEKFVDVCMNVPEWAPGDDTNANTNTNDDTAKEESKPAGGAAGDAKPPERLILSSAEFVGSFEAPDPLIEGILMRKYIYALTGHVAKGKTAVALLCTAHVGLGRILGTLEVEQGRVLYLAGENFVDVQMRWIAMAQQMDFDPETIPVHFRPGRFMLSKKMNRLRHEVEELGGVDFIVVDSSAAFFEGDDENSNAQAGVHARRLRELTKFKGEPCVLVLCHPPKNAGDDNLQPRGAGALIAEWDGNLTATKDGSVTTIHYQIKIRGPDFSPISFLLRNVTHERLKSKTGKLIPTVIAEPLSAEREEEMHKAARNEEDDLMHAVNDHPRCNQAELARLLGWISRKGEPQKSKVHRIIRELKKQKLVEETRSGIRLTNKGREAIEEDAK